MVKKLTSIKQINLDKMPLNGFGFAVISWIIASMVNMLKEMMGKLCAIS
jgi:hypothetical protein